ncbi:hypothetical protein [Paraburkholderia sp. MM6662-R1]|uniref:hypothetical protein n=1 Tax=Paraburkholderia sp. MM6662-R1 TaxID=2991066 RepID=UPI003D1D6876
MADPVADASAPSVIFTDRTAALADLRALLAMGAGQYINMGAVSDDMLWDKLLAAEAEAERSLRVFFSPVEVVPDDAPQAEIDAARGGIHALRAHCQLRL